MAKKDRFAQLHKEGGGALGSFQNLAATVAAIDQQEQQEKAAVQHTSQKNVQQASGQQVPASSKPAEPAPADNLEPPRFMRLPNPKIPLAEYNKVSNYCNSFANMTRQDFVELAIIEKLHNDKEMSDDEFNTRYEEIRNRPARGHRKGTKQ